MVVFCKPTLAIFQGRVAELETEVGAEQEKVEIQPQTQSRANRYFLVETLDVEVAAFTLVVTVDRPDIARVKKPRAFHHPKQLEPIFKVGLQFHVGSHVRVLGIDARRHRIVETARSNTAYLSRPQTISSTRKILLREWHEVDIAVWYAQSRKQPEYHYV